MRIEAYDMETEERNFLGEAPELDETAITSFFNSFDVSDQDLERWINRLPLGGGNKVADARRLLHEISKKTIMAGDTVIRIGRKILEIALFLVQKFPMATAGLVIGALIGAIAGSIPIIGIVLGPIVMPLAMALGLARGAIEDIKDSALKSALQVGVDSFKKLRTV